MRRAYRLLAAIALCLMALVAAPASGRADDAETVVARFTLDKFPETVKAVEDLALSGHSRAPDILQALDGGRLAVVQAGRRVVLRDASGVWRDALTGEIQESLAASATKPVRLNNAVRRAVESALGTLTLLSPDPAKRLAAAESVFRSRNGGAGPALEKAIAAETDPRIRRTLLQAQAALAFASPQTSEAARIAAVATLAERGDIEAQALLRGLEPGASPALKAAAAEAIAAIESHLAFLAGIQNLFYGLSLGSVLLLAAIGLAITFGVMGVINMAHGEMVMIGAYVTFVTQDLIRSHAPAWFDASLAIALPLAFLTAGLVGVVIERTIIRFLYGRPLETLLATWGVSLILQQAVRSIFGPTNREVGNPSFLSGSVDVMGIALTWNRLWIIAFALTVFIVLLVVLKFTSFGLRMRAVVQNRRMAASMGIRTTYVDALTFGLGSGIAGIAGVALSQIDNVSPNLGQAYIIDSFMVVVFGGVGSLWGALVAAMSLGVANKVLEPFAGAVLAKILVLVFIILFIQRRPRGLFALKGRAIEA